jgi:Concanavalin A-like lectin/glucanases superfamily
MKYSINILAVAVLGFGTMSCKKTGADSGITVNAAAPAITTADATNINGTNATIGGNITNDNGSMVKEAGIVYGTAPAPDTSKNKTPIYTISGPFSVTLKNLSLLTKYYYRAYAINEKGITYGEEKTFFVPVNGYSASSQVAASSLVGYWAFNGGYIDSVSKVAGTPNHATAISFVQGIVGQAVQVKSPGYINTNVANTIASLKSFTMAFWVQQPSSLASGPSTYMPFSLNKAGYSWEQTKFFMLFDRADNASNSYGKIALMDQWFDKGQVWPRMLDTKWHQMAISYDGTTGALRVYVDGTLLSQSNGFSVNPQNNFSGADSFTLGGPDDNANTVNGWMNSLSGNLDEFRVFNKVLTADEIMALYALQSHGL